MTLVQWIEKESKKRKVRPGAIITELAAKSEVSKQSIRAFVRGMKVGTGETAKKLAKAIELMGGRVSASELMGLEK